MNILMTRHSPRSARFSAARRRRLGIRPRRCTSASASPSVPSLQRTTHGGWRARPAVGPRTAGPPRRSDAHRPWHPPCRHRRADRPMSDPSRRRLTASRRGRPSRSARRAAVGGRCRSSPRSRPRRAGGGRGSARRSRFAGRRCRRLIAPPCSSIAITRSSCPAISDSVSASEGCGRPSSDMIRW